MGFCSSLTLMQRTWCAREWKEVGGLNLQKIYAAEKPGPGNGKRHSIL